MHFAKSWIFSTYFLTFLSCLSLSKGDGQGWQQQPPQQGWGGQTKGPLGGWDDEVSNPWGGASPDQGAGWKLEDSIPGVPGQSYPNFDKIPETSFDCRRQKDPGYYGDVESQCQVFHICQAGGRQNSFLCPVGTIFNQETFVCDWWFNVNCGQSATHYSRNGNLYRGSDIGIDGSKVVRNKGQQGNSKGSDQQSPVGIPSWDSQGSPWGMKGDMNQGMNQGPVGIPSGPQNQPNKGTGNKRQRGMMSGQNKGARRGGNAWQNGGNSPNRGAGQKSGDANPGWGNNQSPQMNQGSGQKGGNANPGWGNNQGPQMNQGGGQKGGNANPGWGNNQGPQMNQGGRGQKGTRASGNANSGWGNQGNVQGQHPNGNAKGTPNQQGRQGGGRMGQKGNRGGIQRMNPSGNRGQTGGQGNTAGRNLGNVGGDFGAGNRRMKGSSMRTGSIRSFKANSWSMGSQNFQTSGEKGDSFPGGTDAQRNKDDMFQENNPWQGDVNQGSQNDGGFKGQNANSNDWNMNLDGFNQFGGGAAAAIQDGQGGLGNTNTNFGSQEDWGNDYNSWNINDHSSNKGQAAENDYEYVWNS